MSRNGSLRASHEVASLGGGGLKADYQNKDKWRKVPMKV